MFFRYFYTHHFYFLEILLNSNIINFNNIIFKISIKQNILNNEDCYLESHDRINI